MRMNIEEIKIGDYIKVKKGIVAPDFEYQLMDNWQGKVVDIQKDEKLIEIEWDYETLLNTPNKYLKDLIREGYDYQIMTLGISELERANRRDISNQIKDVKPKLDSKLYWIELYEEEDKIIQYGKLFQGIKIDNYKKLHNKWKEYLSENLEFPIETKVIESERGRIRIGDKMKLLDIEDYDDIYGIFGIGKCEWEAVTFPICNLEAINKKSQNYRLLRDYSIWFDNI